MNALIKTLRPHQWVKNVFVLAPPLFAKKLLYPHTRVAALAAFGVFCALSSAVYIFNDLRDVESDRQHPVKRFRAIASGVISTTLAKWVGVMLGAAALIGGYGLDRASVVWLLGYAVLNFAYSVKLKHIAYVDVLCIAFGFELRVLFGAASTQVVASGYLLAVTFLLALFLGFGKRLHEMKHSARAAQTRQVLGVYSSEWLARALVATALATLGVYISYCIDPHTRRYFATDYLALSAPFVAFGMARFIALVRNANQLESPTDTMLGDPFFLVNLALWALSLLVLIR